MRAAGRFTSRIVVRTYSKFSGPYKGEHFMKSLSWFVALFALTLVAGCGGKSDKVVVEKVSIPDSPEGTVKTVTQSIADDKPQALWSAMPEQYQKDVNAILNQFGNKMPADVYDKTFVVINKSIDVLDKQREFIFGSEMAAGLPNKEDAQKNWDKVVGTLRDLFNSEIKTTKGIANLDVESFLGDTGSKLSKNIKELAAVAGQTEVADKMGKLKDTKVVVKESKGDSATLEITDPEGKTDTHDFTKVGGKWVPADIAKNWDKGVADIKQKLADMEIKPADKEKALEQLAMAEQMVDKMLAAKSQEEFNAATAEIAPMVKMMMMMSGGGGGGFGPPGGGDFGPPGGSGFGPGGPSGPGGPGFPGSGN